MAHSHRVKFRRHLEPLLVLMHAQCYPPAMCVDDGRSRRDPGRISRRIQPVSQIIRCSEIIHIEFSVLGSQFSAGPTACSPANGKGTALAAPFKSPEDFAL